MTFFLLNCGQNDRNEPAWIHFALFKKNRRISRIMCLVVNVNELPGWKRLVTDNAQDQSEISPRLRHLARA